MGEVIVRPVSSRKERKLFLEFPWTLYGNDPNWVPPLRLNQKELVGYRRHPFYEQNEAQTFLAHRRGEVCGRIAAIVNRGHIEKFSERRGFFGFFECVDDQVVADALFHAAREWLAERDIRCLRGPTNPAITYEVGTLVEGFDSPPTFMMPYNPDYYPKLIEGHGFHKAHDLYAYLGHAGQLPALEEKRGRVVRQIKERYNLTVRTLDRSRFLEDVVAFLDIFNRSLLTHWSFVPMTPAEVQHTARGLRHLIVPEMALGAEMDGHLVGAVFALPDYNPRIKQIDGRLLPFGFIRLLRRKDKIKKIRVMAANVLPEYQRLGFGLVLNVALVPLGLKWNLQEAEFSWVAESNLLSRGALEKSNAELIKTYRVYDLDP